MHTLLWKCKPFVKLNVDELYGILQLRSLVFVVEQNCSFLDLDNKDQESLHLFAKNDNSQIIAYCRISPAGLVFSTSAICRVVTHPEVRKFGYGKLLMKKSIDIIQDKFQTREITISAQLYLKKFYEKFKFVTIGESYLEDGISHIKMELQEKHGGS